MSLTRRSSSSAPFLTEASESAASYHSVSTTTCHWNIPVSAYFAEGVENFVKVEQDLAFGHLGDVVHALAGVVADTGILVGEAGEYGRDDLFEVSCDFLGLGQQVQAWLGESWTYTAQRYRGGGQADEASISGVRLVHGVGIFVTQLVDYALDLVMVLVCQSLADLGFESAARASVGRAPAGAVSREG